jgi:hypothetical protein
MNVRLASKYVHAKCTGNQLQVIRKSIENVDENKSGAKVGGMGR